MSKNGKRVDDTSSVKLAHTVQQLRSRFDGIDPLNTDPIAVIGMGCRFPGGADSPEAFWRLLRDGEDAITEVPPTRWSLDELYDPNPDQPEKMYTKWGGFVEPVGGFDAAFFGISPREASSMDPQQRLLVEVSWEALENSGYAVSNLAGSPTGVFVGISTHDYTQFHLRTTGWVDIDAYTGTGNAHSVASGRLSYLFGLQGPSLAVDTACSSSLVAIHLACQSLRARECSMALAGGVNLMLSPEVTISFCKARMMAADGRCKTFDSAADGYVRGEGCGMVVLKRLSDALRDNDNIVAVVRGSAINQDGRTSGLTAPSGLAQQAVIRSALANAQVHPNQVSYIEAHGTGTLLGDPIEARALGELFGETRQDGQSLPVGSVKTNIGHLEAAAGVAGLLKVILSLQHAQIPPHLHLEEVNPHIPMEDLSLTVPTELTPWPGGGTPRIAGVSAFAFSGTNAHLVVEEAPQTVDGRRQTVHSRRISKNGRTPRSVERPLHILALSAKSDEALKELATRFAQDLSAHPERPLEDIGYTANTGRSHFANRVATVASSTEQMRDRLNTFVTGRETVGVMSGQAQTSDAPKVAFLFTGQGSQYPGMGRQLYETQPMFRAIIEKCDEIARPHLQQPLLSVLFPTRDDRQTESMIHETAYTQPALFALEYALAELWKSWGVTPAAVMGHSVGEYVAACVAGVFSMEDALKLLIVRGQLMQVLPRGSMAAVFANQARVIETIAPFADAISISAINGPENIVIAGEDATLQEALQVLADAQIGTQQLTVSHAFHSRMMDPMLDSFQKATSEVRFSDPQIELISNLTGRRADAPLICDAQYWRRHTREPVRFAESMQTLHQRGYELFLELGPRPSLLGMGRRCIPENKGTWLPSLRGEGDEWSQMLKSLSSLYISGVPIDWAGFDRDYPRHRVVLPNYPFQRKQHWFNASEVVPQTKGARTSGGRSAAKVHPLLGHKLPSALREIQFECVLSASSLPFVEDHKIGGLTVLPAVAYLEMALAAAAYADEAASYSVEQTEILEALLIPDGVPRTVQFILSPQGDKTWSWQVFSLAEGGTDKQETWKLHAEGKVRAHEPSQTDIAGETQPLDDIRQGCTEELPVDEFYEQLREHGLDYGETLRGVKRVWRGASGEALGQIEISEEASTAQSPYHLHPALLDPCFHVLAAALPDDILADDAITYIPVGLDLLTLNGKLGREATCHATLRPEDQNQTSKHPLAGTRNPKSGDLLVGDLRLFDDAGQVVAELIGVRLKRMDLGAALGAGRARANDWLYRTDWQPRPLEDTTSRFTNDDQPAGTWAIFTDEEGLGSKLASLVTGRGGVAKIISQGEECEELEAGQWTVNPARPADFDRFFREALAPDQPPLTGVVHLWGLSSTPIESTTAGTLQSDQTTGCISALHIMQALAKMGKPDMPRFCFVTRGSQSVGGEATDVAVAQAPLWGLGRVIALEQPNLRCLSVDLDPSAQPGEEQTLLALMQEVMSGGKEDQVAFRQGVRYVSRLVRVTQPGVMHESALEAPRNLPFQLDATQPGVLDNLRLTPLLRRQPEPGEVEIRVHAAGLNFRDVISTLGLYPGDPGPLGGECAGEIVAVGEGVTEFKVGDAVVAIAPGSLGTHATTHSILVAHRPDNLTFEQAATIPIAFLTASYALEHLARISHADRVLIHAAAGGVGMAAVQLARRAGAEIYGTAGNPDKRAMVQEAGVAHVMDSRSLLFADQVLKETDDRGVDIVLNSLSGEYIPKSLSVLATGGRFIEIGKIAIWEPSKVAHVRPDADYHVIDMEENCRTEAPLIGAMLRNLMEAFAEGELQPLPQHVFPIQQAIHAFRYMEQAKHTGKIVLHFPVVAQDDGGPATSDQQFRSDSTYLLTGGLGSVGLEIAAWMVDEGARHLALVGRGGPSVQAESVISDLRQAGAGIEVIEADVTCEEKVVAMLARVRETMPPLRGIIHAAGALDDGVLMQQNAERFRAVMAPKMLGGWNLHTFTSDLELDFFVLFSSVASTLGSPGQGNYAAANAFLDALAHHRHAQGQPVVSINWGPWAASTMVTASGKHAAMRWKAVGMNLIAPHRGVQMLGQLIQQPLPQAGAMLVNWPKLQRKFPLMGEWPYLAELSNEASQRGFGGRNLPQSGELQRELEKLPQGERKERIIAYLRDQIAKVLGLEDSYVLETKLPLNQLGLDSLMAVELKNVLEIALGRALPISILFDYPTLDALSEHLAGEGSSRSSPKPTPEDETQAEDESTIEAPLPVE